MTLIECTPEELAAERERRRSGKRLEDEAAELSLDLAAFVRAAWPQHEPHTPYLHNWHVDAISEHLAAVTAGEIRKLQIWVPPGSMKSRLVSVIWPAWEWTSQPWLRYWTGSYGTKLSEKLTAFSRDLMTTAWYQTRWGSVFGFKKLLEGSFTNDRGGSRIAVSPTSGGTGEHGDRIIIDDAIKADSADATSETMLERANQWYDGTISTRAANPKTYAEVIIMQRLHERDLAAHALEHGGWTVLCLPEVFERGHPYAWDGDPREDGELMWPERFGEEEHRERAAKLTAHRAAGQLQQRPAAREGEILRRNLWRFYDPGQLNDDRLIELPAFRTLVCSWDTAFKEKTSSDFVAGQVWGLERGDRYLLRVFHQRASLQATKTAMLELREWALARWPDAGVRTLIEKSANGVEIIETLRRQVPGVIPVSPSVDKVLRAEAAAPDLEAGNVFLPGSRSESLDGYGSGTPTWVQEFVEECASFPNGAHDDQVDAFTQAINWARTAGLRPARITSPAAYRLPRPTALPRRA